MNWEMQCWNLVKGSTKLNIEIVHNHVSGLFSWFFVINSEFYLIECVSTLGSYRLEIMFMQVYFNLDKLFKITV